MAFTPFLFALKAFKIVMIDYISLLSRLLTCFTVNVFHRNLACTHLGFSSHSFFVTHIFLNVDNPESIDPPIHVLYFLSGGANILIFVCGSQLNFNSFRTLSPKPGIIVVPPLNTILENSDVRKSRSTFCILSYSISGKLALEF